MSDDCWVTAAPYYLEDGSLVIPGARCAKRAEFLELIRELMFREYIAAHIWADLIRTADHALSEYQAARREASAAFDAENGPASAAFSGKLRSAAHGALSNADGA